MSDEHTTSSDGGESTSAAATASAAVAEVKEVVSAAVHRVGDAIETGRKPGMPLDHLAAIARQAPLGSLLAAFLLGMAVTFLAFIGRL